MLFFKINISFAFIVADINTMSRFKSINVSSELQLETKYIWTGGGLSMAK